MIDDATLCSFCGAKRPAFCPHLWDEIQRLREIRKCGKCGRDTASGDCYGCETDRLQVALAGHRAVVRELAEALQAVRDDSMEFRATDCFCVHAPNHYPSCQRALDALAHPLVQQAREVPALDASL